MQRDRVFSPYLLPLDNRVQNSGFEASATPPAGWSLSGTLPISVTASAQTGARAAQLGQPCALPCLSDPEQIPYDQNTFPPSPTSLVVDSAGAVHIAWARNADMYVMSGKLGDTWPEPQELPIGGNPVYLAAGPGRIYMVNQADQLYGSGYYVRTLQGANSWSAPAKLPNLYSISQLVIAADGLDRLHIVRGELEYASTKPGAAGSAALSQSISIPANMHRPTLAFDYSLSGVSPSSGSRLVVRIAGTPFYTATVGGGWAHAAIDLQPWLGQTAALALELQQAAGASQATALIDDLSVGSWRTPVIQQVTPAAVVSMASATEIEIVGENFLATPIVRLGTTTLSGVRLVDAQTLRVTVPAGIKPGRYPLWVINPSGQAAVWPILPVGHQIMIAVTTH